MFDPFEEAEKAGVSYQHHTLSNAVQIVILGETECLIRVCIHCDHHMTVM